eukprot:926138-Rhodomonas_salina.1
MPQASCTGSTRCQKIETVGIPTSTSTIEDIRSSQKPTNPVHQQLRPPGTSTTASGGSTTGVRQAAGECRTASWWERHVPSLHRRLSRPKLYSLHVQHQKRRDRESLMRAVLFLIGVVAVTGAWQHSGSKNLHGDGYECFCPFLDRTVSYIFSVKTNVSSHTELSTARVGGLATISTTVLQSAKANTSIWLHEITLTDVTVYRNYAESGREETESTLHRFVDPISASSEQHTCDGLARSRFPPGMSKEQLNLISGIASDIIFAVPTQPIRGRTIQRRRGGTMHDTTIDVQHEDSFDGRPGQIIVGMRTKLRVVAVTGSCWSDGYSEDPKDGSGEWLRSSAQKEERNHGTARAIVSSDDGTLHHFTARTQLQMAKNPSPSQHGERRDLESWQVRVGASLSLTMADITDENLRSAHSHRGGNRGAADHTEEFEGVPVFTPSPADTVNEICSFETSAPVGMGRNAGSSSWDAVKPHRIWRCMLKLVKCSHDFEQTSAASQRPCIADLKRLLAVALRSVLPLIRAEVARSAHEESCSNASQVLLHAMAIEGSADSQSFLTDLLQHHVESSANHSHACMTELLTEIHRVSTPSEQLCLAVIRVASDYLEPRPAVHEEISAMALLTLGSVASKLAPRSNLLSTVVHFFEDKLRKVENLNTLESQ